MNEVVADAGPRGSEHWVDDVLEHRRMFRQSRFQWAPEDAVHIALARARGRCDFSTPDHLRVLAAQQAEQRQWAGQIESAMAAYLRLAEVRLARAAWTTALAAVEMNRHEVEDVMARVVDGHSHTNRDVRRALHGIPLPNPLTQAWELRQMLAMHQAADDLLEDTLCDLVLELAAQKGWDALASSTADAHAQQLRVRVERQRRLRGIPGDSRRLPQQRFLRSSAGTAHDSTSLLAAVAAHS